MKRFFCIFLTFILILCFSVSVYLYAENSELEEGSLKVFSPRAYFTALSEIEFPDFDFASTLTSIDSTGYYSYLDIVNMLSEHWYSRIFNGRNLQLLSLVANNAVYSGIYGSFTFRNTVYQVVEPIEPYVSIEDVVFYVEGFEGDYSDKILYFFKYIGNCFKTVGEFIKAVLPFNSDYYTILILPNLGG